MPDLQILVTIPASKRHGVAGARADFNASLPATVQQEVDGEMFDVPNPALFASDEAYFLARISDVIDSWAAQHPASAPAPTPAPTPSPDPVNGVPQVITRKQGLKALARAHTLGLPAPITEEDILGAIGHLPASTDAEKLFKADALIEFKGALTWSRVNPFLSALLGLLGLNADAADALFVLAATFTD